MDREQRQITFIDLEEHATRRTRVRLAIVAVLLGVLILAPLIQHELATPDDVPTVSMQAGQPPAPSYCYPTFNVPSMLEPVVAFMLPGWMELCGWLTQPGIAEPLVPSR